MRLDVQTARAREEAEAMNKYRVHIMIENLKGEDYYQFTPLVIEARTPSSAIRKMAAMVTAER